jgi:hypothetical protein
MSIMTTSKMMTATIAAMMMIESEPRTHMMIRRTTSEPRTPIIMIISWIKSRPKLMMMI